MIVEFVVGALFGLFMETAVRPLVFRLTGWMGKQDARGEAISVAFASAFLAYNIATRDVFGIGFWVVIVIYDLWAWWNCDDNQRRRKIAAKAKSFVRFRTFTPSPIPAPGASS